MFVGELNEVQAIEGAGKRFYVASGDTWDRVDAFHYEPPDTREVLGRHRFDLLILLTWAFLPIGLALFLARRVRPVG